MATVKYILQSKSNPANIYVRFSISRSQVYKRKTGFTINDVTKWNPKNGYPKKSNAETNELLRSLQKLENFIIDEYSNDNAKGTVFDGKWLEHKIKSCFDRKEKTDLSIFNNWMDEFIASTSIRKNSKGGTGLSKTRVFAYKNLKQLINDFKSSTPILLAEINIKFKNDFHLWMVNNKGFSPSYSARIIGNLKTVLLDAQSHEIEVSPQLNKFSRISTKRDLSSDKEPIITLSVSELEKIEKAELKADHLKNARQWLIIGCLIGQRGGDLLALTSSNIVKKGGVQMIELVQQKGNKAVVIPVVDDKLINILSSGFPRPLSTQKFNEFIKEVCRIAELDKPTHGKKKKTKHGVSVLGTYPKWELIASHVCRRTFATNYYAQIPTPLIMSITGHTLEKTFLQYIGKTSTDNALSFAGYLKQLDNK